MHPVRLASIGRRPNGRIGPAHDRCIQGKTQLVDEPANKGVTNIPKQEPTSVCGLPESGRSERKAVGELESPRPKQ